MGSFLHSLRTTGKSLFRFRGRGFLNTTSRRVLFLPQYAARGFLWMQQGLWHQDLALRDLATWASQSLWPIFGWVWRGLCTGTIDLIILGQRNDAVCRDPPDLYGYNLLWLVCLSCLSPTTAMLRSINNRCFGGSMMSIGPQYLS